MSRPLPFLAKLHPLTGKPIQAIGWRPNGDPLWPIMGGDPSNDPPERPDDVPAEEWDALGDPGKVALVRERAATAQANQTITTLRAELAKKAKPAPPKSPPPGTPAPKTDDDQSNIAAIVQSAVEQAVGTAIRPFQEAEEARQVTAAAEKVRAAVMDAARDRFQDATDALQIDLTSVVGEDASADATKIKSALDELLTKKPHLAKGPRTAPVGVGGAPATNAATSLEDQVKAQLATMQAAAGVRVVRKSN